MPRLTETLLKVPRLVFDPSFELEWNLSLGTGKSSPILSVLYYINLDWRDGWHGETLFYNPNNLKEIIYTSLYIPGRIILFDGSIPHAIRPQSIKAPKFRFTLSLFFD